MKGTVRILLVFTIAVPSLGLTAPTQSALDLELKYGMCNRHSIPEDKCTDEVYRQLLDSELRVRRARQEAQRRAAQAERKAEKARLEKERTEREANFALLIKDAIAEGKPARLRGACEHEWPGYGSEYDKVSETWACTDKEKEAIKIALPQAETQEQTNETVQERMKLADKDYRRIVGNLCATPEYSTRNEETKTRCKTLQDFLRDPDNVQGKKVCSQEVAGGPLVCTTK
jgi:hypothetical protein